MDADLDTLATALYVTTDDLLKNHPERVPARPKIGLEPRITDAEPSFAGVAQQRLYHRESEYLRSVASRTSPRTRTSVSIVAMSGSSNVTALT